MQFDNLRDVQIYQPLHRICDLDAGKVGTLC